jgi:branched-chain amino acid transport system permease protein
MAALDRAGAFAGRRLSLDTAMSALLFAALALVPMLAGEAYLLDRTIRIMAFAIAAIGLDLILGYGGLISFGHAAFMGIGAYAVGVLAVHGIHEAAIALPIAIAAAALFALVTGAVALRTKGVYFIMITLAFGQMAFFTASSLAPYGGDDGLTIPTRDTLFGYPLLADPRALYYVAFASLATSYLLCGALIGSRFGRVFRGARENPFRMAAIGFDIYRFQLAGYVVSGALGGLAGFILASVTDFVSPAYMSWQRSGDLLIMVIFGGTGRLYGAVIGAIVYLLAEEKLAEYTEHWRLVFGPLLVAVAVFAPGGLIGLSQRLLGKQFPGKPFLGKPG